MKDHAKLKALLEEQEKFPLDFIHKFIGKHTPEFLAGVTALEAAFPRLKITGRRGTESGSHLALTCVLTADSADDVVKLFEATERVPDLVMIL